MTMPDRWFSESDIGREFLITVRLGEGGERTVRVHATLRAVDPRGYLVETRAHWLDAASEQAWHETHESSEVGLVPLTDQEIDIAEVWVAGPG
jgi:hypothetical protein